MFPFLYGFVLGKHFDEIESCNKIKEEATQAHN